MADRARDLSSIQGEQQRGTGWVRASDDDVDRYVDRVSDEVLTCWERGRHRFSTIRRDGIIFTEVDQDGLFVRRMTCICCRLVERVEKWEGARHGRRVRFQLIWNTEPAPMAKATWPHPVAGA